MSALHAEETIRELDDMIDHNLTLAKAMIHEVGTDEHLVQIDSMLSEHAHRIANLRMAVMARRHEISNPQPVGGS